MTEYIKKLKYTDLTFIGLGSVIGAGIFALIGKSSKYSGNYTWVSMIIAGAIIYYISRSYVKISKTYKENDAEAQIVRKAFGKKMSNALAIGTIISGVLTIYIVSDAFGGYMTSLSSFSHQICTIFCILLCALINFIGISEIATLNTFTTIIGIFGLLTIIALGIFKSSSNENINDDMTSNVSIIGVLFSAYILLLSYFGFESLIKFTEESIDPNVDICRAINTTIITAIIIYSMIAFISVRTVPVSILSKSDYPLVEVTTRLTDNRFVLNLIKYSALFLTFNTSLLLMGSTSRFIESFLENDFKIKGPVIMKSSVPVFYIMCISIIAIMLEAYKTNIISAASLSNFCKMGLFLTVVAGTKHADTTN